jgi:gamma-glutamylcyclotransferase (GGCT)/AIG2-like uncharacterized protein YtfP
MDNTHTVLVYGTLRPFKNTDIVLVPGYLYDLGWFPGIELADPAVTGSRIVCERITVDEEHLAGLDNYEGCHPGGADSSLYTREQISDEGGIDGKSWIYVYRKYGAPEPFMGCKLIESGNWQEYSNSVSAMETA